MDSKQIKTASASGLDWRKSSYSNAQSNCVEIAPNHNSAAVRDSKYLHGPVIVFQAETWRGFLTVLIAGEFRR
ncbi:DUF397 domain-containing protein [Streptomyces gobiensis]|uniref:DUF397 domain-containing protein n=1 Tax=Streptomyces gobiensis TaxID=2875706 RepID=UPI001E5E3384|nr:DUF397 domain-containing protein [Streptomyces gobiensis]UGY94498.1 DUF397 domain-containing protein [Streptomyces gobiensis]